MYKAIFVHVSKHKFRGAESGHSFENIVVCGLSLYQGNTESRKTSEQKIIFQIGTLAPNGINKRF